MADEAAGTPMPVLTPELFRKLIRESQDSDLQEHVSKHSDRLLLWLGLVPAWPKPYVALGFPTASGFVSGSPAIEAVESAVRDGLVLAGRNDAGFTKPIYWMSQSQFDSVLAHLRDRPGGRKQLLGEMPAAASALRSAMKVESGPSELERWCRIAEAGPDEKRMAAVLDDAIEAAILDAQKNKQSASPEAGLWIEAATPLAELLGGPLFASLLRARRRFELFHRQAADLRHLKNFVPRGRQIQAFRDLLEAPDNQWALHYVGGGGSGKTMLLRHITSDLAPKAGLAVARIDFDSLNPDFPSRRPALLLDAFGVELRLLEEGATSAFKFFSEEVASLHQSIDADRLERSASARDIESVVLAFVDAVSKLRKRPLLILDTCEELAKLRPDGRIPENVRVTFEVLERIHKDIPSLRVIFSGRRPLASVGLGWTCPTSQHPPRTYLRLYIVSGFDEDDARRLLSIYRDNDRAVDPSQFDLILSRSVAAGRAFEQRFELAAGSALPRAETRYDPFDLSMYASLSAQGQFNETSGVHQYIKQRIVDRNELLAPRLPLVARLGTFDRTLLERLFGNTDEASERMIDEIVQLEWVDRSAGEGETALWSVDPIIRERLLNFYRDQASAALGDSERLIASILPSFVKERGWHELSVEWFRIALELQQHDRQQTLEWWDAVEKRITKDGEFAWAHRMTAHLLPSEDGTWEEAQEAVPDPIIRATIMATHAAAAARIGRSESDDLWQAVLSSLPDGTDNRLQRMRHRACAGIASAMLHDNTALNELTAKLRSTLAAAPAVELRTDDEVAIEIALREAAVEILERAAEDSSVAQRDFAFCLDVLASRPAKIPAGTQLHCVLASLAARTALLRKNVDEAVEAFARSLRDVPDALPQFLDWVPPDDLRARLQLEAIRSYDLQFDIHSELAYLPTSRDTLDGDRFAAAMLIRDSADSLPQREAYDIDTTSDAEPARWARFGPPRCNAHRLAPSWLSVELEIAASLEPLSNVIALAKRAKIDAESRGDVLHQNDMARLLLRLITRLRLFDEGERAPEIVRSLTGRNDAELLNRFATVTGTTIEPASADADWNVYLTSRATSRPLSLNTAIEMTSSFTRVWFAVAAMEVDDETYKRHLPKALEWVLASNRNAADALRIAVRLFRKGDWPSGVDPVSILDRIASRMGRRRAAELVFEEYEAAGSQQLGTSPLLHAADWFLAADDRFGALRARVLAARMFDENKDARMMTAATLVECLPFWWAPRAVAFIGAIQSSRQLATLTGALETSSWTRPWSVRLLSAAAVCTGDPSLLPKVDAAIDKIYALRTPDLARIGSAPKKRRAISGEMFSNFSLVLIGIALVSAAQWVIWQGASLWRSAFDAGSGLTVAGTWVVTIALVWTFIKLKDARQALIGIGILGSIWTVAYRFIDARTFQLGSSFSGILVFNVIVGVFGFLAFQVKQISALLARMRKSVATRIEVTSGSRGGGEPYPGADGMRLVLPIGSIRRGISVRESAVPAVGEPHVLLHSILADETATTLNEWIETAWESPLPATVIFESLSETAICWEAVLDPSWFADDTSTRKHLAIHRRIHGIEMHRASKTDFIGVATAGTPQNRQLFSVPRWDGLGAAYIEFKGPLSAAATPDKGLRIAHIIGVPVMIRDAVRLQVGDSDKGRSEVISPDFAKAASDLLCCIVQGPPTEGEYTAIDRQAAASLRRFGAEVARAGVPLVIVLPPLSPSLGSLAINSIADDIANDRWFSIDDVVATIDRLRGQIAATGQNEMAYDLCVYIDHLPKLLPRSYTRSVLRWLHKVTH